MLKTTSGPSAAQSATAEEILHHRQWMLMVCVCRFFHLLTLIIDIVTSGNESPHQIGSSVNITCSSDLSVQTIRWMNDSDNGRELFSNSGQQQLLLPIERVTSSLANTMYTCEVQVMLATGRIEIFQQAIMIQVHSSKKDIYLILLCHFSLGMVCGDQGLVVGMAVVVVMALLVTTALVLVIVMLTVKLQRLKRYLKATNLQLINTYLLCPSLVPPLTLPTTLTT